MDIVAANGRRNTIEILLGDGRGRFAPPSVVKLVPGYNNYSFALGDIDGDGHLDLVAGGNDTGVEPGLMVTMHGDGKGPSRRAITRDRLCPASTWRHSRT